MRFYTKTFVHSVWTKVADQDSTFINAYTKASLEWRCEHRARFARPQTTLVIVLVEQVSQLDVALFSTLQLSHICLIADTHAVRQQLELIYSDKHVNHHQSFNICVKDQFPAWLKGFVWASPYWFAVLKSGETPLDDSINFIQPINSDVADQPIAAVYFDHYAGVSSTSLRIKPTLDPILSAQHDYISNAVWFNSEHVDIKSVVECVSRDQSMAEMLCNHPLIIHSRPFPGFRLTAQATSTHPNNEQQEPIPTIEPPLVSVIIPTRNQYVLLNKAVDSVLATGYPKIELIIVDNQSNEQATITYLQTLALQGAATVLRYDSAFNYSAINNFAVAHASGELLCFLNNDIEALTPNWLQKLTVYAGKPNAGAIGAKLLYPDQTIQHAGVVVGLNGIADHIFKGIGAEVVTNIDELNVTRQVTAVTAACLLVKKQAFIDVGGFNQDHLAVAFNDVDLCLKLNRAGLTNIWVHDAVLLHHESISRGLDGSEDKRIRFASEVDYMRRTWGIDKQFTDLHTNPSWCRAIDIMRGKR